MKRKMVAISMLLALLTGCRPSEMQIQTAIAQTQAANPTIQPSPSDTPTASPSATLTATTKPTSTVTPLPATQTVQAKSMAQTLVVWRATATQERKNAAKTATAIAKTQFAEKIAPYKSIRWEELAIYTASHLGEQVDIRGKIIFIQNTSQLQIQIGNSSAIVFTDRPFSGLYVGNWITVYGTVRPQECFDIGTRHFCYPVLDYAFYIK